MKKIQAGWAHERVLANILSVFHWFDAVASLDNISSLWAGRGGSVWGNKANLIFFCQGGGGGKGSKSFEEKKVGVKANFFFIFSIASSDCIVFRWVGVGSQQIWTNKGGGGDLKANFYNFFVRTSAGLVGGGSQQIWTNNGKARRGEIMAY